MTMKTINDSLKRIRDTAVRFMPLIAGHPHLEMGSLLKTVTFLILSISARTPTANLTDIPETFALHLEQSHRSAFDSVFTQNVPS